MPGSLLESNSNSKSIDGEQLKSSRFGSTLNRFSTRQRSSPLLTVNLNNESTNNYNHPNQRNNNQLISSARSDRSDGSNCDSEGGGSTSTTTSTSNKKVSFNKAVRVKKYSSPPTHSGESKFWFRVHKADNCDHLNTVNNQLNQHLISPEKKQQQRHHHQHTFHLIQSLPSEGKVDLLSSSSSKPLTVDSIINSSQLCDLNCKGSLSTTNCDYYCATVNENQPNKLIESEFKSSSSPFNKSTNLTSTMPPISSNSRKDGVKIIDYSIDDDTNGCGDVTDLSTTKPKGSEIDDNLKSSGGKSTQRIINYEPYKSASTIALDIDSALRPRSPSPVTKNGRHSSVDSASRTINSNLTNSNNNNLIVNSSIRPGSVASEEIVETKTVEKKNPILSGVKVMFGVKAKRAPTFPTMPNRSKSVDRTNNNTITTIKPTISSSNKTTATIVRPTFASRTTSSALKSRDSTIANSSTLRSRQLESTNPTLKSSLTSRNPPLTSSLKKTPPSTTPTKSVRDVSTSRVSTKSPSSLVSSEINKLMSTVSTTKKPTTKTTSSNDPMKKVTSSDHKGEDNVDSRLGDSGEGTIEMARERPADQSTGDLIPVATWSSGPVLISNVANKETSSSYIPGEGKLMASFEEGTKVWKSKTRRVYEEPIKIPREKSTSPDRQSSSSRAHSPDRYHHRKQQSRDRSPERVSPTRSLSPKSSGQAHLRAESPERSPSSTGYRSPRHRSPSPIIIERKSPAVTPITVDIEDENTIDGGGGLKKSNRTRFSPTHETFYRSSSSVGGDNHHQSLPTGDDLDEIFLRKDIYPSEREPNHQDEPDQRDDLIVDYTPKMEDKACQCNLKRSSKSRAKGETDSLSGISYRVIKPATDGSVSTFSNVPDISDAETELDRQSHRPLSRDGSPIAVDRRSPSGKDNHHHSEVIYSQIDRTKKRPTSQSSLLPTDDDHYHHSLNQPGEYGPDDYLYESNAIKSARSSVSPTRGDRRRSMETSTYRHQSPSPSPSRRYLLELERKTDSSSRPNKTVSVTHKTYGLNMRTALDAPEVHLPTRPPSTKPIRVVEAPYHHHQPTQHQYHPHDELMSKSTGGRLENHQQSKSRMRGENLSGDEVIGNRRGSLSDPDDLIAPKSIIREIDHRKGEINYENVTPRNRSTGIRSSIYENGQSTNNSMWFRSLDDDYRKGLSERESFNNNGVNHHHHHPHHHEASNHNVTDYCTMTRRGRDRLPSSRDVGADYPPPSTMQHAYTLDRRHLDRAKRSKRPGPGYSTSGSHLGISSPTMSMSMITNGGLTSSANNNNNSPSMAMRKYNSTRDLSHLHSQPDFIDIGSTRGGLAAAYKARQRRASSLSRFGQSPNHGYHLPASPSSNLYPRTSHSILSSPNYPLHSGSHSQLHRLHLTGGSEIGGYHPHHHYSSHHPPLRSSASHIGASYGHSSSESDAGLGSHQRTISGSRSRLTHHQNEPVVLYIPAISHHHRPVDEDDRNSALGIARTQSILSTSKRSVKGGLSSSKDKKRDQSKDRDDNFNEITNKVNGYLNNNNNKNDKKNQITSTGLINEGDDEIIELRDEEDSNNNKINGKKKDVKRSVSIPKDTKLPWLQKLKMKVKS